MARTIRLTRGVATLVDDDVYEWASRRSWYAQPGAQTWYAMRRGPRDSNGYRISEWLHRTIIGLGPYVPGGLEVDHIDGDGLNNRRSNLRAVTHQGNALNRDNGKLPDLLCPVCGSAFSPGSRRRIYCSSRCFGLRPGNPRTQRILPDYICPTCGDVFRPHNHRSKYCSYSCRNKGYQRNL